MASDSGPCGDLTAAITTTPETSPVILNTEPVIVAKSATTTNTTAPPENSSDLPLPPTKRQRRPSVRLGEIGDQPAATLAHDMHMRRNKQHRHYISSSWRPLKVHPSSSSKSVKPRCLTNTANGNNEIGKEEAEVKNQNDSNTNIANNLDFGHRKAKAKRGTTRRSSYNWVPKIDEGGTDGEIREDGEEESRDFDPESGSPFKDQSPVNSVENLGNDSWQAHKRQGSDRGRLSESRENELDYNPPESDSRDRRFGTSEGVMTWLLEIGLSRYAPVFEIHEVDEEALPMLTLEDLKDMGINAVGSRRKLYSAILKLRKGFS